MKPKDQPKRPPGRPATGITPKRYFRMDDESWALIEQAAQRAGVTISDWIRERLTKAAKREARSA
jgi:predicted HicB family RNase H-like nuclease